MKNEQSYQITDKTKLKRMPKRGVYNVEAVNKILDETFICHIGFLADSQPCVIPICYGRENDKLFFHGAKGNRMFSFLKTGSEICITVSIVDGLVLARSAFHHSLNYRSVVIFGKAEEITNPDEKNKALRVITEQILPGRWAESREPNNKELNLTSVFSITLDELSAKVREGGPVDEKEDMDLNIWAGVLPLKLTPGIPLRDSNQPDTIPLPDYIINYKST